MKRNNTYTDGLRKKTLGARLTEVMALKGMDRSKIREILKSEKYKYPLDRQTFYKYQNGVNWMPADFTKHVSEILDINEGYLLGDDNLICENYDEYREWKDLSTMENSEDYFRLFKHSGLLLSSSDNEYSVSRIADDTAEKKRFSEERMKAYYKAVLDFMYEYLDKYEEKEGDADDLT